MFDIGATFIFTVLTCYTLYRYIVQRNALFEQLAYLHINFQVFYTFYAIAVIYAGDLIAREVNSLAISLKHYLTNIQLIKNSKLFHPLGKKNC